MPRIREKPIHEIIKRIWDKKGISTPKEAALRSGTRIENLSSLIDTDRVDALVSRLETWADQLGITPAEFLSEIEEYIQEDHRKIS